VASLSKGEERIEALFSQENLTATTKENSNDEKNSKGKRWSATENSSPVKTPSNAKLVSFAEEADKKTADGMRKSKKLRGQIRRWARTP